MPVFGSDQLRCSLVQDHPKNGTISYILSRADGTIPDEVETSQKVVEYRYPKEKKFFDWKFIDHTYDMRNKIHRVAAQEAFNSIQKLTKLKINHQKDSTKQTDFAIEWFEDIEKLNGMSVISHTWLFSPNSTKNGVIQFNDSLESKWYFTALGWRVPAYLVDPFHFNPGIKDSNEKLITLYSQPLVKITMHALGHVLGLNHDMINKISLMYPSVSRSYINGKIQKNTFYWDDITSIPKLTKSYGTSHIITRTIDRWIGKRTRKSTYQ